MTHFCRKRQHLSFLTFSCSQLSTAQLSQTCIEFPSRVRCQAGPQPGVGWTTGQLSPWNFQKHVQLIGTTTSYNHFALHPKIVQQQVTIILPPGLRHCCQALSLAVYHCLHRTSIHSWDTPIRNRLSLFDNTSCLCLTWVKPPKYKSGEFSLRIHLLTSVWWDHVANQQLLPS